MLLPVVFVGTIGEPLLDAGPTSQRRATDIELRLDLRINGECPSKHQRSIQVIPEPSNEPNQGTPGGIAL